MKLYSVRDVKSTFKAPMAAENDDLAIREFYSAVQSIDVFQRFPADFSLYYIGDFDERSGVVSPISVPEYLCCAFDALPNGGKPNA